MDYSIRGKLSSSDLYSFYRYYIKRNIAYGILQVIAMFAIILVLFSLNKLIENPEEYIKSININYIFFVLLFSVYSYVQPLINYKKYYSSNKFLHDEQTININEDSITISTKYEKIIIIKEYIFKIGFDKKRIYIYKSNNSAEIIPLSFCKDINEFNEIKRIIYQLYNPKYLLKKQKIGEKKNV